MGSQPIAVEGRLDHLPRTDGSATFSHGGYTVVASVNGPMEAQRRDENPFQAVLEVVIRPAAGVGGTRERHLESVLQAALRQLVCVKAFPRSVFQITLQLSHTPTNDYANNKLVQAQMNLPAVPPLLHASILALLSGAVPLKGIATCLVVAVPPNNSERGPFADPSPVEASEAASLHLFGFTPQGALLLAESEGDFTTAEWEAAVGVGQKLCCRQLQAGDGAASTEAEGDVQPDVRGAAQVVRLLTEAKSAADSHWR